MERGTSPDGLPRRRPCIVRRLLVNLPFSLSLSAVLVVVSAAIMSAPQLHGTWVGTLGYMVTFGSALAVNGIRIHLRRAPDRDR